MVFIPVTIYTVKQYNIYIGDSQGSIYKYINPSGSDVGAAHG